MVPGPQARAPSRSVPSAAMAGGRRRWGRGDAGAVAGALVLVVAAVVAAGWCAAMAWIAAPSLAGASRSAATAALGAAALAGAAVLALTLVAVRAAARGRSLPEVAHAEVVPDGATATTATTATFTVSDDLERRCAHLEQRCADLDAALARARAEERRLVGDVDLLGADVDELLVHQEALHAELDRLADRSHRPAAAGSAHADAVRAAWRRSLPPDDLGDVTGIGPRLARQLRSIGVVTFRDLALVDGEQLARVRALLPACPDRVEQESWQAQARALHVTKYGEPVETAPVSAP